MSHKESSVIVTVLVAVLGGGSAVLGQAGQHKSDTHTHAAAAKMVNPVKPDDASVSTGRAIFTTHCTTCHGPQGAGDGAQAAKFTPRPSSLSDAQWKHGPSDGEIFAAIRNGVPKTAMSPFSRKMTGRETWDVVNYIRSIGPGGETPHAH